MDTVRVALLAAVMAAGCSGSREIAAFDGAMPDRVIGGDASEPDAAPDGPGDAGVDAAVPVDAGRDTGTDTGPPVDAGTDADAVYECDVVEQDCVDGEACRLRLGERGTVCMEETGLGQSLESCDWVGECQPWLQCTGYPDGPFQCKQFCRADEDCGDAWTGVELECVFDFSTIDAPDPDTRDSTTVYMPDRVGVCAR